LHWSQVEQILSGLETAGHELLPLVSMGALEAAESQRNPEILEVTPKLIPRAGMALNGAYALFLDNFFHGATTYALAYQPANLSPRPSAGSSIGRRGVPSLGRATNTPSLMNSPTLLACPAGMNGSLIPAHTRLLRQRSKQERPLPISCAGRTCPLSISALMR
jgi:hypothetical protein